MNFRVTGKKLVYMGRVLGNVYFDEIEIKGGPQKWVNQALEKMKLKTVQAFTDHMATGEEAMYPFVKGKKMKGNVFWRNANHYAKSLK